MASVVVVVKVVHSHGHGCSWVITLCHSIFCNRFFSLLSECKMIVGCTWFTVWAAKDRAPIKTMLIVLHPSWRVAMCAQITCDAAATSADINTPRALFKWSPEEFMLNSAMCTGRRATLPGCVIKPSHFCICMNADWTLLYLIRAARVLNDIYISQGSGL